MATIRETRKPQGKFLIKRHGRGQGETLQGEREWKENPGTRDEDEDEEEDIGHADANTVVDPDENGNGFQGQGWDAG